MSRSAVVVFVIALLAQPLSAQVAWDAPPLVGHAAPAGVSLFALAPAGGDVGGLVTYRGRTGPGGLGYRLAVSDQDTGDGAAVAGGIDVSGFLSRGVEGAPLDVIWWSGLGAGLGEEVIVSVPAGALVGWSGQGGEVTLSPYAGGHVSLDFTSFENDEIRLVGSFDLGVDLVLASGWLVRFGASVGDRDALALGVRLGG